MFALGKGFYSSMTKKEEYFVVLVGLDNAGKTTFLERAKGFFNPNYKSLPPSRISSTVGLNIGNIEHSNALLTFWDLGGHPDLQTLWDKYLEDAHGIIFMVDSTDSERLEEAKKAFEKVLENVHVRERPVLVLFNKCDVHLNGEAETTVAYKSAFANGTNDDEDNEEGHIGDMALISTSGLEGTNVERAVRWMVDAITRRHSSRS